MMSSAALLWKSFRADRESHSGMGRKPFAFPPESLFGCSASARNRVRLHPGTLFAFTPESRSPSPGIRTLEVCWKMITNNRTMMMIVGGGLEGKTSGLPFLIPAKIKATLCEAANQSGLNSVTMLDGFWGHVKVRLLTFLTAEEEQRLLE